MKLFKQLLYLSIWRISCWWCRYRLRSNNFDWCCGRYFYPIFRILVQYKSSSV